jgi:hypothetical protein
MNNAKILKLRQELVAGDVVCDEFGTPLYRVTSVHRAKAKNYLVIWCVPLARGFENGQTSGHRHDRVMVLA